MEKILSKYKIFRRFFTKNGEDISQRGVLYRLQISSHPILTFYSQNEGKWSTSYSYSVYSSLNYTLLFFTEGRITFKATVLQHPILYYIIYIILQAFYFDKWEEIFVQTTISTAPNIITFYCSQKGGVCLQAIFSTVP